MNQDFYVFDKRTNEYAKALRIDFEANQAVIMAKNKVTVYMSGKEPYPICSLRKLSDISLDLEIRYPKEVYVVEIRADHFGETFDYAAGVYVTEESAKYRLEGDGFYFDKDLGVWDDAAGSTATITLMKLEE